LLIGRHPAERWNFVSIPKTVAFQRARNYEFHGDCIVIVDFTHVKKLFRCAPQYPDQGG
jgi:hypothetical protein